MDYSTLVGDKSVSGSIKNWINYTQIPVTAILTEAQADLYRHLRTREMRAEASVTIAQGAITAALPSGFLDPIKLRHRDKNIEFRLKPDQDLAELRLWDETAGNWSEGLPTLFAIYDELLQFDVRADEAYPCTMLYYKQPDALSLSNETNWLTTRYPRLLRAACLRSAADFMENMEKYDRYDQQVKEIIQEINVLDDLSLTGMRPSLEYDEYG